MAKKPKVQKQTPREIFNNAKVDYHAKREAFNKARDVLTAAKLVMLNAQAALQAEIAASNGVVETQS